MKQQNEPTGYTWGDCVRAAFLLGMLLVWVVGIGLVCAAALAVLVGVCIAYQHVVPLFPALPYVLWGTAITSFFAWACLEWANEERLGTLYETDILDDLIERGLVHDRDGAGSQDEVVPAATSEPRGAHQSVSGERLHEVALGSLPEPAGDQEPEGADGKAGG